VGFGADLDTAAAPARLVTEKELLDYGFLAEFLGRLPVRVELQPLSEDDLYLIMTGPPDAVVREYQALLKIDGVDLRFSEEGLRAIAESCIRRRTGARSLRTIVEEICHDVMFEAPERKGETVTVDGAAVASHLARLDGAVGAVASGK
jgi:ATP-dependent Clp protease ATP-binding subunit ClpX